MTAPHTQSQLRAQPPGPTRRTALALGAGGLLTLSGLVRPTPAQAASTIRLDNVPVVLRAGSRAVVTVNRTSGHQARVVFWQRRNTTWTPEFLTTDGRIGYGGLVAGTQRRQGSGATPLGTYGLFSSFGTHGLQPGWGLPYRKIESGDFWVQDNASNWYNRLRNQAQGGFRWNLTGENGSERLSDYGAQYEYSVVTDYNYREQVRYRGSGIFLHVNGRGATAGCVSVPRHVMVALMPLLHPAKVPLIAIGT
ncbi:L,D-transpeptidase family protein [Nocardioides alkalitolerans]|uniref:L,D-transpeptidase family protein n=1 Tax=Nocardioides alkalitolerans TaxID=281714 RepID=UPI0003F9E52C|nr:L,D-transpeptidase family protein [Nocardioides alkalitolerans]